MYDKIIKSFDNFWTPFIDKFPDILVSLVVLIIFIIAGKLVYRIFKHRIQKKWKDSIISSFLSEFLKWAFYIIGFTIALYNLGLGGVASSLIAGAGISAIIIGFAFKDIAENFLAGILLAINRPFSLGDIIEVGGIQGPVKGLDLRTTLIKTADGRDIYIPNSMMITNVFTNYTKDGLLRLDFLLGLDTFDDIEKARILIINHLSKEKQILKSPAPNAIIEELGESSISIKVMFWINIFKTVKEDQSSLGEPLKSKVMREIKDLLLDNGFNMPARIVEHKMYNENNPLKVKIDK
ncbi:MAG: mechanosensitive ion channel family protein [Bacteroidales bacterium]|nr:mechanosensitive ion channel family protein [Bacteroidales bacterium]MCF8402646.1 mechanosensitive ion channel family protein [Bacteroidales bacterium]